MPVFHPAVPMTDAAVITRNIQQTIMDAHAEYNASGQKRPQAVVLRANTTYLLDVLRDASGESLVRYGGLYKFDRYSLNLPSGVRLIAEDGAVLKYATPPAASSFTAIAVAHLSETQITGTPLSVYAATQETRDVSIEGVTIDLSDLTWQQVYDLGGPGAQCGAINMIKTRNFKVLHNRINRVWGRFGGTVSCIAGTENGDFSYNVITGLRQNNQVSGFIFWFDGGRNLRCIENTLAEGMGGIGVYGNHDMLRDSQAVSLIDNHIARMRGYSIALHGSDCTVLNNVSEQAEGYNHIIVTASAWDGFESRRNTISRNRCVNTAYPAPRNQYGVLLTGNLTSGENEGHFIGHNTFVGLDTGVMVNNPLAQGSTIFANTYENCARDYFAVPGAENDVYPAVA